MSRWRRFVLPASVILNLFFVALIATHLLRHRHETLPPGQSLARALANAEATLPPQDAAAFGAVMQRDKARLTDVGKQLVAARQELARLITEEHYDRTAVRQAFTAWATAWSRFQDAFSDTLTDALAEVSPEGRRQLVESRAARRTDAPLP
jgi:uncharacterized membrane protein